MKKKYFLMGALALTLAVAGGYGVKTSMNSNAGLNPLALANVEALARDEVSVVGCEVRPGTCVITINGIPLVIRGEVPCNC